MPTNHFNKGDKVEVTRGDDLCLWFPATVLRSSSSKHNGEIQVEYETLTSSEGEKKRIREYVCSAKVRPSLPVELHQYFKIGDKVDAFHDGAWCVGKIGDILENSKYLVSFDRVPQEEEEEFELDHWNLRVPRNWENGSWLPPLPHKRKSPELEMKPKELKLKIKFSGRTSEANFSKGTMVEVSSNKEGYQGSWYNAVIVDLVETDKFLVEYKMLRTDDETELLKENVDASYIRPYPPEIAQIGHFKQFQEVDAWYNDGWWMGHIFEVIDDYKYVVQFMNTTEEMTLEHSKLRPHQDWIDGKWVSSSRRSSELELQSKEKDMKLKIKYSGRTLEANFSKGAMVEVKSDEEGYQGSWYTAEIVDSIGKDKFLVEYQTLKTEDENELLKEKADPSYIRPCPPIIQRLDRFRLFEKVDAWYNDGWWVGLVFRVLDGLNYAVYFWNTNEELEFGHFNLRPHQEWICGKWVADFLKKTSELPPKPRPGKLKIKNGLITLEANYFSKGMKIEVKSDEDGYSGSWYPAVIVGSKGTGKYLVEYRTLKSDNEIKVLKEVADAPCIRPCPPLIQRIDRFELFEEVDVWYNDAWWVGSVCKVLQGSKKYTVYIRGINKVLEFQHSNLRPHQDWTDGKWVVPCRGLKL